MRAIFRIPALRLASALASVLGFSMPSAAAVDDSLVSGVEATFVIRPGYGLLGSGRDYGFYQLGLGSLTSSTSHMTINAVAAWRSVTFGNHYGLALKADSTLWGWGRGATYAFGDGTTNNRSVPSQVGSEKWIKVVAGLYVANTFGIRHDSTLWVWGRNQGGGLGTGDGNAKTTPVQLGTDKWLVVSNINNHGLGIRKDSTLWGWGWSSQNNLTSAVSGGLNQTPAQLDASGKWIHVFAGYDYSFGIKADSTLWSWGYNQYGLTGLGTTSGNQATPTQLGSSKWLKVHGNQQVVMALRADSTLWSWGTSGYSGSNAYGSLGQGPSVTDISTPGQIGSSKWRDFSLGSAEAIAIDASGAYWAWGKNAFGGIGDGTTTTRFAPVRVSPGQTPQTITFSSLAAKTFLDADFSPGASASSGLTVSYASSDPAVATIVSGQIHLVGAGTATITASQAGNSTYGQATEISQTLTVSNPPHPHKDRKITGGNEFTLVIRDGIGVYGTGRNSNYRLGLGDTVARNRYHLVAPGNWRHVDGGGSYSLALKEDSTLWGWGYQYYGFGDGATQHNTPAQIGSSHWITVSAGLYVNTNLGIRADSTLWAWGDNNYGLYGNGTTSTQSAPTQVGSDKWLTLSHASIHVLGIKADHTLWAWGYANSGRLGNGATSGNVTSPIQIGSSRWLMVAAGYETSYAIRSDSSLWSWGVNMAGGTGLGTTTGNTTTPAQVGGAGSKWIWVGDANWGGVVAMKADSTLWTWGSNAETLVAAAPNNATPGQVGSAKWRQVALGYFGGLGQDAAGDFYGWGNNSAGHIGDSSNTTRTAPTLSKFNRSQSVTFAALPAKTYGDAPFALSATAGSGLSITYSSSDTAVATVSGSTVTLVAPGSTDITASQAGSADFEAASAIQTLTVNKVSQTITFNAPGSKTFGDAGFSLGATASSGLSVDYASSDTNVARISGSTVTVVGAGSAEITASQAGNGTYAAASNVARTLTVDKANQTLAFPALSAKTTLDADFAPGASSSSSLAVSYSSSDASVATMVSGQIHIVGAGTTAITASQAGDGNYNAAADSTQSLTVDLAAQAITFNALSARTYGDAAFALSATAGSGLPATYASSDTTVARISGDTLTVVGAGSADITASQSGNSTYAAATDVVRTLTINKASQSISFPFLAGKNMGDADFAPGASASSGLSVSYASSNTFVATIVSGQIHIVGAGTTTITASQAGDGNYHAASDSAQSLTVSLAPQSITFNAPSAKTYGDSAFALGATASSNLAVSYASSDTMVARVYGSSVTLVGAGSVDITASQAGNGTYAAASDVVRTLTVNRAGQTISFSALPARNMGDADFAPGASATSGLTVSYASSNTSVATLVSGQIHIVGAGIATITASQAGNADYNAAADSSQTLTVSKLAQTITFNTLSAKTHGDAPFPLDGTAGSGLSVTYASSDTAVAQVSGATVTVIGAGTADITASQAGNHTYSAASDVVRTLTINKASQTLSFPALAAKTMGDADFAPGAVASSGLMVSYASSNTAVATLVSGQIHIVGAGTAVITASQAGNANYNAASDSAQTLTVSLASQSITFNALSPKTYGDGAFALGATASSGLSVTYTSSDTTVARISGSTVTLLAAGSADINASQAGNSTYAAATDVVRTLMVNKADQTISFHALPAKNMGDADFAPGASSSSGLAVSYASSNTSVAALVSGQIHITGAGTATITASQGGDANHNAATDSTQTLTVSRLTQTITFNALPGKTYGDAAFTLTATAGSGLTVTYASSDTSVAKVSGSTVTVVGAGSTDITASQAGDGTYAAAADRVRTFTVDKANQALSFPALAAKTMLDADFAPGASATSGLTVTYASSNTSVATLVSGQIHIVGAGIATITASQAGNADYNPAADSSQTLTVSKLAQTITFNTLSAKTYGDAAFSLGATAGSGLTMAYASSDTSVAQVSGSTVTVIGAGTADITASQAGNHTYSAASDVVRTLTINKASQTLSFPILAAKTMGDADFAPGAAASSGLMVSYVSSNAAVATLVSGQIHIVGAGTAVITASQGGDANNNAATDTTQTLTVSRLTQTITFNALSGKTYGDAAFALTATAGSGLTVTYASSDTTVAKVSGSTVTVLAAGSTDITASQAGDGIYSAATDVVRTLTVNVASQTIAFPAIPAKTMGDADFTPGASATSGLPVSYASSNTAVATVVSGQIHLVGVGTANITASQAGNADYEAAADLAQSLSVGSASQTITFTAPPAKTFGDAAFALSATAGSGLTVSFTSSDTTVARISGSTVTLVGAGSANITASQAGDGTYSAAPSVMHGLTVDKASQTIAFPALSAKIMGDADFAPGASAHSGLSVSYASSKPAVATVVSGQIHIVGPGTADITASQAGNGNHLAAADAVQTLTVTTASQAITFAALPAKTYGDSAFAMNAAASSGLTVAYASSDTLVARISGSTVTVVGAGTADITASQGGNGATAAAPPVTRTLTVAKASQILTFPALPARTFGDADFAPGATSGSGLIPAYASSDTAVAAIVSGQIHLVGSGTAVITASQAGNADYLAAAEATQTLTVTKAAHTLAFSLGTDTLKTEGDAAFKLNAASSVGLAVRFTTSDTAVIQVAGDSVRIGRAGLAELTAHQDGNTQYAAAAPVILTLRVRTAIPTSLALQELDPSGIIDADTSMLIRWSRKEKASGYRLHATVSPLGSTLLDTSLSDTSCTLVGLAFGSTVKWRVAPFNATGQAPFSPTAAITVRPAPPVPVDVARVPIQGKEGMGTTVELTWPPVDNSTGYRIQASLDGAQGPLIDTVIAQPPFTLQELAPGGKYVWRVAPVNGSSEAPFTPWLTFSVRDKDDGAVTKGIVVDSGKDVKVNELVAVAPKDGTLGNVTFTLTEEKKAPANLPEGFLPLTGNINLSASVGAEQLNDSQLTITLTPPDTSLDGTPMGGELPLVYTIDSITGDLRVVYDLPRDSAGRIVLPLSQGRNFILAVDTVAPVLKDSTPTEPRPSGSNLVISGVVDDNIRNCRTTLRYRRGGEEIFDSVTVTIDASGHFELPLDLALDSTGFEYSLSATDGRNRKGTPSSNVPVEIKAIKAKDSLPSMQWRLFALPTLPRETRWADLAPSLGTYGEDWKLFARTSEGLKEFGAAMEKAEAGAAYWLKSRKSGFTPAIAGGVAAPVNKPFERVLPPKSWISFGNPFLFPVSWQAVLDSSHAAATALVGPYTFRDTAWVSPLEIPALQPWEGYYAYNATQDTLRIRIPALKAKNAQPVLAKAAFHLQWQVRGADRKDAGNFFGGLGGGESALAKAASVTGALGTASQAASRSPLWQTPKPESPDAGLRAGFVSSEGAAGLLQTDFRSFAATGGLTWSARLSGLTAGRSYANRFIGFESLPEGTAVAVADPVTGSFTPWKAGMSYTVEAQAGEESRELLFYAGSPQYVQSRGAEFSAAHPFIVELKNYPNPMRGFTVIQFAVPVSVKGQQRVKLSLCDMQGRLVRQLAGGPRATGRHSLRWDGLDSRGRGVAAGSYRLLLEIGNRKMNRPLQILP